MSLRRSGKGKKQKKKNWKNSKPLFVLLLQFCSPIPENAEIQCFEEPSPPDFFVFSFAARNINLMGMKLCTVLAVSQSQVW